MVIRLSRHFQFLKIALVCCKSSLRQGNWPNNLALCLTQNFILDIGRFHIYGHHRTWDIFAPILKWLIFAKMAEFLGNRDLENRSSYGLET